MAGSASAWEKRFPIIEQGASRLTACMLDATLDRALESSRRDGGSLGFDNRASCVAATRV